MEKLKRNVILSLAIAAIALVVLAKGVFATSGTVAMQTIPTANTANTAANTAGNAVKEKGLMRLEGKDYIMQDGDIVLFRFNV